MESFARRLTDFVIAATLDIDALRAFQSRAKRWPQDDDKFKPVQEGFKLAKDRKIYLQNDGQIKPDLTVLKAVIITAVL